MAARRTAVNSELVLDGDNAHVGGVEKVGSTVVRSQVLLLNLKANDVRIVIAALNVIDRHCEAPVSRIARCYRSKQIGSKRGNAAFAWQVVPEERSSSEAGLCFHTHPDPLFSAPCRRRGGGLIGRTFRWPRSTCGSWHSLRNGCRPGSVMRPALERNPPVY